jgi:hypothetical protein
MQKFLLLVFIGLFVVSCSSSKKSARRFMKNGNYLQARSMWIEELTSDPDDKDALKGKKEAEYLYINQQMILTRDQRTARQHQQSMTTALNLKSIIKEWKTELDQDGSKFFATELDKLWLNYKNKIILAIKNNFPLRAKWFLITFSALFKENYPQKISSFKKTLKKQGQSKCAKMKEQGISFYFWQKMTSSYCKSFSVHHNYLKKSRSILKDLYKLKAPVIKITTNDQGLTQILKHQVSNSIKQTPWYHPKGKKQLHYTITGNYSYQRSVEEESRSHPHTYIDHYEEYDDVSKTRSIPYETEEMRCPSDGRACVAVKIKKFRSENYQSRELVKKSRHIQKYFNYTTLKTNQIFSIDLNGLIYLERNKIPAQLQISLSESDYHHSNHRPDIGLNQDPYNLTSPESWRENQVKEFSQKVKNNLIKKWDQENCKDLKDSSLVIKNEMNLRCAQVNRTGSYPAVDNWFKERFNLTSEKVRKVIGTY